MDNVCVSRVDLTDCSNCCDLCLGPVIFPCGHLFCRKCVRQLIVREGLPAHCSSCHQIIPLVQGETISDLIDNMYKDLVIEKMVYESLRQDKETSCDLCQETKVTHMCLDCRHYLCNTCSNVHSVSERSYGHKQQTLPTTWTTAEIHSQDEASGLEALCRNIECCQVAEETVVDTQTTRSEVEMILYDEICQLKNSGNNLDSLITSLQNVKVRLTIKQQILGMYAAELAKHDQSLVQTQPFLNRVRQIKEDSISPIPHLAALEKSIHALAHCGYMTSERPNTLQRNADEAREVIVLEQMVEISLKKRESENQVTLQTTHKNSLSFKGMEYIKTASRSTIINTDAGTVQLETISDHNIIAHAAENILVAKIDWSNDRIQKLASERKEIKAFEEKNKTKMMKLEKDIIRVTRQLEDERRRSTQRTEEERRRAAEEVKINEARLRYLEDNMNRVIKQLEDKRSRLEEERKRLKSLLDSKRTRREIDFKVMNAKHKNEIKKERNEIKTFQENNERKIMQLEKDIIRITKQIEDERRKWTQRIEEARSRAKEQMKKKKIRFTQEEEERKNVMNQLEEERSRLTVQLEEERKRLTLLLEEERKRREADLEVMNAKHREETKQERKNVIRFVMRLEGRDRLLSGVLQRVEDGHLSQVVRQLLHDFHIRLQGVDCGLNFLMEVPASLWGGVVQEQLQGVLSDLVPETDRQEVTWSRVRQLESSHDSDLRLGGTMLAPETATKQCGYMTSERHNTQHVKGDEAREVNVVEQMVEITLKKRESENQVTSQTTDKSPLTFKGVDCIKTSSRSTTISTDLGTVQLVTISDPKVIMQAAENIVVAKIDWSNDQILKLESERMEMKEFEEKNKTKIIILEKNIIRVTRQLEDERRRWTQRIVEERRTAGEEVKIKEITLRKLNDEQNRVIKQLEEKQSTLEEERRRLISQLEEERTKGEADLKVMNAKRKEETSDMKAFEEKFKGKILQVEKDIIRVTRQLEDERRRWTQVIEEERRRWTQVIEEERSEAKEQVEKMEIRFTQEEEKKNVLNQLEEERSRLTLQLEEERKRLTLLLEEERKRREADLKVMNEKHREETKQERKNEIRFVMRLEGRDRLLSDVLGRIEDGHLSQIVRQLVHDSHIRLLGVDCGLNFLMEVPESLWGEDVQEYLQGVLIDLVPETDRQKVTWSSVMQLDISHDSDLRLGGTMPVPETDRQEVTASNVMQLESWHDSDLRLGGTMLAPETATKQTPTDVQGEAYHQSVENEWLQCVEKWYPHLHWQTYFLPPLHFNRVPYCVEKVAGRHVLVPQITQSVSAGRRNNGNQTLPPVSDSDVRDDRALQRVLHGLRSLADNGHQKEVMFVVSQLQFDNYLGEPSFAPTAALLPRPSTLPEHFRQQHYDKGDFDVLIIHGHHGLFILEINSVGEDFGLGKMAEEHEDNLLIKKAEEMTQQLNKAEVVLRHLTSDMKTEINITKSLVMPNIKSSQLQRAINRYPSAGQVLCQCLGVQSVNEAVKLCLLSDQISDKQIYLVVNHNSLPAFRVWWQHVVGASGTQPLMTSSLYKQLVTRFCGPATTVEVYSVTAPRLNIRTLGEAVSETGERVARLVLIPQQMDILNQPLPGTFLIGPPGTGKTSVLTMQGLTWLQRGHDVHVVSTCDESRAATTVIEHQLQETAKTSTAKPHVHRHQFDFWKDGEVETALSRLKSLSEGRQLCVIADEVVHYSRERFKEFCDKLIVQVPGVFIWSASLYHDARPLCLEEVKLTTPLRSPPVVVREVMESWQIKKKLVHDYTVSDVPIPTDGPPVMRIEHRHGHSEHTIDRPLNCVECGRQVASVLTKLDVGQIGDSNGPPPLQYRDFLVVSYDYPTDDRVDRNGHMSTKSSGLVRGLRDRHVPVRVLKKGDEAAIHDTALGVGNLVTVANWRDVQGLERKVVVVETEISMFTFDRLFAMSRCTSQLVLINW